MPTITTRGASAPVAPVPTAAAQPAPAATPAEAKTPSQVAKDITAGSDPARQPDSSEGQTAAQATAPEATQPEEEQLSPKFAALARKERALRSKIQEMKAKEEALKAKEAELSSVASLKQRLAQDPMGALSELGISYEQLTNAVLNQPSASDVAYQKLQAEIQALKDAQNQSATKFQEQQQQQYEAAVSQLRSEAQALVQADPAFETIKEMGMSDAVVELIKETYNQQGVLLDVSEAAEQVENHLIEEAMRFAKLKKVQTKLAPEPQPAEATKLPLTKQPQQPMKTLTNAVTAQSRTQPLSAKERRERAILAFKGQLK